MACPYTNVFDFIGEVPSHRMLDDPIHSVKGPMRDMQQEPGYELVEGHCQHTKNYMQIKVMIAKPADLHVQYTDCNQTFPKEVRKVFGVV
jgi:hypothetical protein